jgi:hypothetical protein
VEKSHKLNHSYKRRVTTTLLTRYGDGKIITTNGGSADGSAKNLWLMHSARDVKRFCGSYYPSRWTERNEKDLWPPDLIPAHFHTGYYVIRITCHSDFRVLFYVLDSDKEIFP